MAVQKLSSKNQIMILKEARQAMGVKGGDKLLVVIKDDLTLIYAQAQTVCAHVAGACQGHLSVRLPEARTPVVVVNVFA